MLDERDMEGGVGAAEDGEGGVEPELAGVRLREYRVQWAWGTHFDQDGRLVDKSWVPAAMLEGLPVTALSLIFHKASHCISMPFNAFL